MSLRLGDVAPNFKAQTTSGIDPGDTCATSRTIVQHSGFYSAELGMVGYLMMKWLLHCCFTSLLFSAFRCSKNCILRVTAGF